jgi:hypothetical protein
MRDQMIWFIYGNRLLSPYSTATALLKITNDIQHDCDRRLVTLLLLLKFSKAFDNDRHSAEETVTVLQVRGYCGAVALVGSY